LLFNSLTSSLTPPEVVIYLDVTAEEAIRRIRVRGRKDELLMPEEYWENLHECYTHYYRNYSSSPLLKIDVTRLDYVNRENNRKYMTKPIGEFLASRQLKIG
jgi:deoxyadenosine/deoxycytidine kinase